MGFVHNLSPEWIEEQYRLWLDSPEEVAAGWSEFFTGFELGGSGRETASPESALKQSAIQSLIYRYRDIGHLLACTDPLSPCMIDHPLLSLAAFGLDRSDLDREFHVRRLSLEGEADPDSGGDDPPGTMPGTAGAAGGGERRDRAKLHRFALREIIAVLRETYCRDIGVEFMHIQEPAERQWLIDRMEPVRNRPPFSSEEKVRILEKLLEAGLFESFLSRKFTGQTRFSLEGGEVLVPQLDALVSHAARRGITDLILGMPHRGRLNVLANVFRKPLGNIVAEFGGDIGKELPGKGDVKYHKGFSVDVEVSGDRRIHLTMAANPSHLEAIDPVIEGKCRARQDHDGDGGAGRVLPVLIHGDAAFSGQGVVAETFNLSQLAGFRTGGTLHIVLNNQIGFTTLPKDARSSTYATDVAKMVAAPVFHVQGERPEAVIHATRLALDYRREFGRDVVVEVICYRRHGHNEGDEPYFTQPLMYEQIKERPPVSELYATHLREEGVATGDEVEAMAERITARFEEASGREPEPVDIGFRGEWGDISREYAPFDEETGVTLETLVDLASRITRVPDGFALHRQVEKLLKKRRESVAQGGELDWGTAETLAFATLLAEGCSVRLSGEDVRRGTFSQRHSVLFDTGTGEAFVPLAAAEADGAAFHVYDSMLSENAVLGFEYGYSIEAPHFLTIWEAQYGDFANGAQVVFDQFVSSGETKWDRVSGLVTLLPHGYEGLGPDHSTARPERYLQLCADNNMQVAFPSTPAQYFHLLRRQMKQPFRKPLIVLTPKSLLRHPLCVSPVDDFTGGRFREIIPGSGTAKKVRAVLLCSGKMYIELRQRQEEEGGADVDIVRIEQLYPLRTDLLKEALGRYGGKVAFSWVQEEPANMGAWSFLRPQLSELIGEEPRYVGREAAASPAVGYGKVHKAEQEKLIDEAFSI